MRLTGELTAASTDDRTLTYRLLPYGEPGRTSMGSVYADTRTHLEAAVHDLNLEHDRTRPVGRSVAVEARADGLYARYSILETTAGSDLLVEARSGLRAGVSVELDPVVLATDGHLVSGTLIGAGAVTAPAFASAVLTAAEAAQLAPDPDPDPEAVPAPDPDADPEEEEEAPMTEPTTATAVAVADPTPAAVPALTASVSARPLNVLEASERIADAFRAARMTGNQSALTAALVDITATGSVDSRTPAWLGQVWEETIVDRPFVDSVSHGTLGLSGLKGWAFTDPPDMAAYAGDKAAIPSDTVALGPVTGPLARLAVGHDVDRALFDFDETEFIAAYWHALAASYARKSEAACAAAVIAGATAGAAPPLATTPGSMIVTAVSAVIAGGGHPTFIGLGATLYTELLNTGANVLPALLNLSADNAMGVRMFFSPVLAATQIVAGDREAFTYAELSGTPIRVEAQNIPNGGIDLAGFGYYATVVNRASALYKATRAATVRAGS